MAYRLPPHSVRWRCPMVIINRNDLSTRSLNRVETRLLQGRNVTGFGAKVSPAGSPSPRPTLRPQLAVPASIPGLLASGYPVHLKRTAKPGVEGTLFCASTSTTQS